MRAWLGTIKQLFQANAADEISRYVRSIPGTSAQCRPPAVSLTRRNSFWRARVCLMITCSPSSTPLIRGAPQGLVRT